MTPTRGANRRLPAAPAMPPRPTIEPTALLGNMSEARVKMLADQPWCAAAARPMTRTAVQRSAVRDTVTIGTTHTAQRGMAALRARLTVQPRLISPEDSQPPPMLPMLVIV